MTPDTDIRRKQKPDDVLRDDLEIGQLANWQGEGGMSRAALNQARVDLYETPAPESPPSNNDPGVSSKLDPHVEEQRDYLERMLLRQLRALGVPEPKREYRFHDTRKWRFDFAWPELMVAAEVEGGTWSKGKSRHTTGAGFHGDLDKYNAAKSLKWTVFQFDSKHVESGQAAEFMANELREHCV